eukprot:438337-Alexandrium_andersonii.AAC.1
MSKFLERALCPNYDMFLHGAVQRTPMLLRSYLELDRLRWHVASASVRARDAVCASLKRL